MWGHGDGSKLQDHVVAITLRGASIRESHFKRPRNRHKEGKKAAQGRFPTARTEAAN